jgi:hypothetical protein
MSKNTDRTIERLRILESEVAKLISLRKEEIFKVLELSGGLTLDNRLLAGLAAYASDPANRNSGFLKELMEIGKKKIPSKRFRSNTAKSHKGVHAEASEFKEKKDVR